MVRPSSYLGYETPRVLFTTPEIEVVTREPFEETLRGERLSEFGAFLDAFSEYGQFSVSNMSRPKPPDTMLARVDSTEPGFWSFRVTDPAETAGIRGLGAFVGRDEFFMLGWDYQEHMENFTGAVLDVEEIWRDHFGSLKPIQSESVDDHLTNYILS